MPPSIARFNVPIIEWRACGSDDEWNKLVTTGGVKASEVFRKDQAHVRYEIEFDTLTEIPFPVETVVHLRASFAKNLYANAEQRHYREAELVQLINVDEKNNVHISKLVFECPLRHYERIEIEEYVAPPSAPQEPKGICGMSEEDVVDLFPLKT